MKVIFDILDAKAQRIIDAIKFFFPIPHIPNPDFGQPDEPETIPEFTDSQWAKEAIRRYLINLDHRYRVHTAKEAINEIADDNLVS